jgi:hypothetical protein
MAQKSTRMPFGVRVFLSGCTYPAALIAGLSISGKNFITSFAGRGGENRKPWISRRAHHDQ